MQKDIAKPCICSICGVEAVSIPGTRHRRCSGKSMPRDTPHPIQAKEKKLGVGKRGIWEKV